MGSKEITSTLWGILEGVLIGSCAGCMVVDKNNVGVDSMIETPAFLSAEYENPVLESKKKASIIASPTPIIPLTLDESERVNVPVVLSPSPDIDEGHRGYLYRERLA